MCGIVGYVGDKRARDVVIEGLRRLEYRGYDSAGIALADTTARSSRTSRPASSPTSRSPSRRARCPTRRPASGTRAGPPTVLPTTSTRTRTSASTAGWRSSTTASSRTSRPLRSESRAERPRPALGDRHRGRRPPASRARLAETGDLTTAMQSVCRRLEGAFTLVAVDAQDPERVVGGPPQLPAGGRARRGRELPRLRRRGVHRPHPRGDGARPGPGRDDHPRRRVA